MSTFYNAPNDYRNYLCHYGVKGMKRPHGLKYRKRGGSSSIRDHRRAQARKTFQLPDDPFGTRTREENERARQEHEAHMRAQQPYLAERRRREEYEQYDEDKRRRQQALEEENRHRADAEARERANTKAYHQTIHPLNKNLSRLADQVSPQRVHRRNDLLNQARRVSRRRHGH